MDAKKKIFGVHMNKSEFRIVKAASRREMRSATALAIMAMREYLAKYHPDLVTEEQLVKA